MLRRGPLLALLVAFISVIASIRPDHAPSFVAFSLRQAEREAVAGRAQVAEVADLAGMTDLIGWVYDSANKDHVLVGISRPGQQRLRLDHFVAALRAVIDYKQFPEVSIDPPGPNGTPGKQPINFKGGIENTSLGQAMYQADVHLKHLALGKISGQMWSVPSYLQIASDNAERAGRIPDVLSKFYFVGGTTAIDGGASLGVVTIHRLSARVEAKVVSGPSGEGDASGTQFAAALSGSLPDLALEYPALATVAPIMKMVAIARVLDEAVAAAPLTYWRQNYRLPVVPTPPTHDLEFARQEVKGLSKEVSLQGGIATGTTLRDLRSGDSLAFRDVVLKSRPTNSQALSWSPPLEQWDVAGDVNYEAELDGRDKASPDDGFYLHQAARSLNTPPVPTVNAWTRDLSISSGQSSQSTLATIPLPKPPAPVSTTPRSPQWAGVGGVMLSDTATVRGAANVASGILGTGRFSLILDDKAAVAEPMAFRRFVTALWAVYFGDTDPGISIDPISRGNSKQLVRYVGDVKNSDLGRVMREADYLMKHWAVGASRPALSDFANPDDLAWKRRTLFLNAMSRFWFVPQDMTFKATSDALLFDSGRMTVKTEFLALNSRGLRADPANEDFAAYLTTNYQKLAGLHPVLRELEEYAKLVSLAKYLKQSGAPLYWFLLANKDLVLTEESPGTVDAIFRDSANFSGVKIEGGVELTSKENYVLDTAARQAIEKASANLSAGALIKSTVQAQSTRVDEIASFDLQNKKYSIVPQHSTSSGKDFRGIRYQTDVSVHLEGFALTKDKLADLQPALKRQEIWDSLRPIVERLSESEAQTRFRQLYEEAETKAANRAASLVSKLALLTDKDYRDSRAIGQDLEYSIGKDDFGRFGALILKYAQYRSNLDIVRFFNPADSSNVGEFGKGWHLAVPYRLALHGSERREFQNVTLPAEMEVTNVITGHSEVLAFSADRSDGVGYFPASPASSPLSSLLLHPDASMRLTDKIGCWFEFDRGLRLAEMRYSPGHVVKVNYADSLFKAFDAEPYEVDPADQERVDFRGVSVLKRLKVQDMYGRSETLTFGSKNNVVGYVPDDPEKSRFELLALLSGGSFQLRDKQGVEVRFSSGGHFEGVILPASSRPISNFEMGRHRVVFRYSIDRAGHIIIDSAWVSPAEPGSKPMYVVSYKYEEGGSLARASLETPEGKAVLAFAGGR